MHSAGYLLYLQGPILDAAPMTGLRLPRRPASYTKRVALVLQGGGALGSYQAGVYEALAGSEYLPDWVAGISIGAINAAIIAGNAPERRVERLRQFWEGITAAVPGAGVPVDRPGRRRRRQAGRAASACCSAQPGFFAPRTPPPGFARHADQLLRHRALKRTLERLVDFDRINAARDPLQRRRGKRPHRQFRLFRQRRNRPSAPSTSWRAARCRPAFPPVEIDGEYYWDGGLVSNTPLQYVLDTIPRRSRLSFQVDLFPARGTVPTTISRKRSEREKDIRYSSRTRAATDSFTLRHDMRHYINLLWAKLPPELRATPEAEASRLRLHDHHGHRRADLPDRRRAGPVEGLRVQPADHGGALGAGPGRCADHTAAAPWLAPMPLELGVRTFDVLQPSYLPAVSVP